MLFQAEICGAVFASCLKKYFEQYSRIKAERWCHFVDSQRVLGELQREIYGYQTFFANRIGEIQNTNKKNLVCGLVVVPGTQNIADIITRGASPESLDENSEWQNGPKVLTLLVDKWPLKAAKELALTVRSINYQ